MQERARDFSRQQQAIYVKNVAKAIGGIIIDKSAALPERWSCETIDEIERISNLGNLLERMEKLNMMDELNIQTSAAVENASTFMKLVSSAEFLRQKNSLLMLRNVWRVCAQFSS